MITAKLNNQQITALVGFLTTNAAPNVNRDQALFGIIGSILDGARARWIELAGERLKSSRQSYIQAIQPVVGDPAKLIARIDLLGKLANMIEEGMSAMDLHDAFLGPGKGRRTAGGRARAIPFRHASLKAGFGTGGLPMGGPYRGHSGVSDPKRLGEKIYRAAQQLPGTTTSADGKTNWGGALPSGFAPKLKPMHATDIYARMVRLEKTYERRAQSQYITFRTIAVDDDGEAHHPGTWIHPGIPAANLVDEVSKYVEEIAVPAALAYLGKL